LIWGKPGFPSEPPRQPPQVQRGRRSRPLLGRRSHVYPQSSGRLAQLGERLPYKQEVRGSIPRPPIEKPAAKGGFLFGAGFAVRPARIRSSACSPLNLERCVGRLSEEARDPAAGRAMVLRRVPLGEYDAERERVTEAQSAHRLGGRDRVDSAAPFQRALELMPQRSLRSHERMFAEA
jgi:hypothetical protein